MHFKYDRQSALCCNKSSSFKASHAAGVLGWRRKRSWEGECWHPYMLPERREGSEVKGWLKRGENQSSESVWLTACQSVFCGGVKRGTIALSPSLPSLSLFLSCLIRHSLSHPSSHYPILLNVSPNTLNISTLFTPSYLFLQSLSPPHPLIFFSSPSPSHSFRRDALTASHLGLLSDTPLILLFPNLHRKGKWCSSCTAFI